MIIVKVGLSKKLTRDFNSQGFSLDIESELPSATLDDPQVMADATGHLFQLASDLLDAELAKAEGNLVTVEKPASPRPMGDRTGHGKASGQGRTNGYISSNSANGTPQEGDNGRSNGGGKASGHDRPITEAQVRAIQNMARRLENNEDRIAQEEYGVNVRQLTIKQASQLIDRLKQSIQSLQPEGAGR